MSEQQILEASRKLFAKYGYDYVSVRKIASEANVNIGSISYYFHNKIGILERIVNDFYKGLNDALDPTLDGPILNKADSIKNLTRNTLEYMFYHFDSSRTVMREISLETDRFEKLVKPHYVSIHNKLVAFFERMAMNNPRHAAIKYMALSRYPFSNVNIVEFYFQRPFNTGVFDEYVELVLSAFYNELSA